MNWDHLFGATHPTGLEIDPNARVLAENTSQSPRSAADPRTIQIPGFDNIRIKNGTQMNIVLANPAGNPCYFRFTVYTDTGTEHYRSKLVPPGQALYAPLLTTPLRSGAYTGVIQIETFALDDRTPMNGANVKTLLIVE